MDRDTLCLPGSASLHCSVHVLLRHSWTPQRLGFGRPRSDENQEMSMDRGPQAATVPSISVSVHSSQSRRGKVEGVFPLHQLELHSLRQGPQGCQFRSRRTHLYLHHRSGNAESRRQGRTGYRDHQYSRGDQPRPARLRQRSLLRTASGQRLRRWRTRSAAPDRRLGAPRPPAGGDDSLGTRAVGGRFPHHRDPRAPHPGGDPGQSRAFRCRRRPGPARPGAGEGMAEPSGGVRPGPG